MSALARSQARPMLLLLLLCFAAACGRVHSSDNDATAAAPDSLIGVLSVTGTEFFRQLVLRVDERGHVLSADVADSAALSRLGGLELVVRGRTADNLFRVATFTVRSADGAPVVDGVVQREGDRLFLLTTGGKRALGNPPDALRAMIGARVWIGGPLDTGPNVYGLIAPAR